MGGPIHVDGCVGVVQMGPSTDRQMERLTD